MYAFAHFVDERYVLHAFRHLVQFCLDLGLRGLCCVLIFGGIVDSGTNIFHVFKHVGAFGLDGCVCCLTQIVNGSLEFIGFAEDVRVVCQLFRGSVQACCRSTRYIVDVWLVVFQPFQSVCKNPRLGAVEESDNRVDYVFFKLEQFFGTVFGFLCGEIAKQPVLTHSGGIVDFLNGLVELLHKAESGIAHAQLGQTLRFPLKSRGNGLRQINRIRWQVRGGEPKEIPGEVTQL